MHALYSQYRNQILFGLMAGLLILVAVIQSPSVALTILNLCLISAIMSLGVNIQWGYAGLFNVGVMGFAALGGFADHVSHESAHSKEQEHALAEGNDSARAED